MKTREQQLEIALRYCLRELRHVRLGGPWSKDARNIAEAALMGPDEIRRRWADESQLTADGQDALTEMLD